MSILALRAGHGREGTKHRNQAVVGAGLAEDTGRVTVERAKLVRAMFGLLPKMADARDRDLVLRPSHHSSYFV